jgi:leader peptidase (prepilin peptidase)/N-methyltransferase
VTGLGAAICALLGLAVGLFLNVVIDRVPPKQPLLPLRFRCPRCPEEATDRPGLPLLAWLRPRHRCPVCGQPLPLRYLAVPLANAALFAAASLRIGIDWALPAFLVFFAALLAISVIDLQLQIIPNRIVYPAIFLSVALLAVAALVREDAGTLRRALISGALAWVALFLMHVAYPRGMGFGDVRLSFLLGLFLGWFSYGYLVTGLFLGFVLTAVVGTGLMLVRGRSRPEELPFGPFLAAGATLAVLVGDPVVRVWLG